MQNRAFLPTRLRNKEYCFYVGWGTLREKRWILSGHGHEEAGRRICKK